MNRKLKWGLGALIILTIVVAAVILIRDQAKLRQMEADLEAAKQKVEELNSKKQEQPIADNGPPPAEPGYKWVRHGDHWDKVKISEASFKREPLARPKGPPLNIDWGSSKPKVLDWTDPRTAESYRNYYGFYPPTEEDYFKPVQDNFGNWIKHYRNTSVIVKWGKRIGFRPTINQFARYKQLQEDLELARALSFNNEPNPAIQLIEQEIRDLVDNAKGEIPTLLPRDSIYYGDATTPEQDRIIEAEARKALYKRMGIEHLYEFYEIDPYKEIKRR